MKSQQKQKQVKQEGQSSYKQIQLLQKVYDSRQYRFNFDCTYGTKRLGTFTLQCMMKYRKNWVPTMTKIYISSCGLDDNSIKILMQQQWPNLNALWLRQNSIRCKGIRWLTQGVMPELAILNLSGNNFNNEGFKQLTKSEWPNLKWLVLKDCYIGDDGIHVSTKFTNWPNLKTLTLKQNEISVIGAIHTVKYSEALQNIKEIKLYGNSKIKGKMKDVVQQIMPLSISESIFVDDG